MKRTKKETTEFLARTIFPETGIHLFCIYPTNEGQDMNYNLAIRTSLKNAKKRALLMANTLQVALPGSSIGYRIENGYGTMIAEAIAKKTIWEVYLEDLDEAIALAQSNSEKQVQIAEQRLADARNSRANMLRQIESLKRSKTTEG